MYQGIWGTICDDGWDDIDATVVCRELGYLYGNATRQHIFGSGYGPVWLSQVGCLGGENKLSHCIHTGAGNTLGCSHARDAGVQCVGANGTYMFYVKQKHVGVKSARSTKINIANRQVQPKTLISAEAKKLLYQIKISHTHSYSIFSQV